MQTFLPYTSFEEVAKTLDSRRLGKQRVEGMQILNVLAQPPGYRGGWFNHPAVKMWRGYENALKEYVNTMITGWKRRGYQNNISYYDLEEVSITYPWWLGDVRLHRSHQSNLLRKEPEYYRQFGWDVPDDLPYFWPVP
ncbi:MAG TPA: MSMEG_6728 family protein [Ktedonobacteraceae bacterium]|nr:MSMEG_6728 family protein [Ktedonobacteraceae bacterium]